MMLFLLASIKRLFNFSQIPLTDRDASIIERAWFKLPITRDHYDLSPDAPGRNYQRDYQTG